MKMLLPFVLLGWLAALPSWAPGSGTTAPTTEPRFVTLRFIQRSTATSYDVTIDTGNKGLKGETEEAWEKRHAKSTSQVTVMEEIAALGYQLVTMDQTHHNNGQLASSFAVFSKE